MSNGAVLDAYTAICDMGGKVAWIVDPNVADVTVTVDEGDGDKAIVAASEKYKPVVVLALDAESVAALADAAQHLAGGQVAELAEPTAGRAGGAG